MKKLMMAVSVALLGLGLNAAIVAWDNGDGDLYSFIAPDQTSTVVASGYIGYFFSTLDVAYDQISTDLSTSLATTLSKGYVASDGASSGGWIEESTGADVASFDAIKGSDGTGYLVLFNSDDAANATHFYVSATDTETIASAPGAATSFYFDLSSSADGANWTAVPEPTSGLLLVVGGALLALRRRRLA